MFKNYFIILGFLRHGFLDSFIYVGIKKISNKDFCLNEKETSSAEEQLVRDNLGLTWIVLLIALSHKIKKGNSFEFPFLLNLK